MELHFQVEIFELMLQHLVIFFLKKKKYKITFTYSVIFDFNLIQLINELIKENEDLRIEMTDLNDQVIDLHLKGLTFSSFSKNLNKEEQILFINSDGVDDWRVRDPQMESQRPERNDRYERSDRNDRFERSERSDRSDRPNSKPREYREQREQRDEGNWRTERQQPAEGKSITGVFESNRQNPGRKPLNLKPRSVDKKDDDAPRAADPNKKDPFGGARARDENLYQKKKQETPSNFFFL